jgi:glycerol-3-phosphate acyltransferase PlsY
MGHSADGTWLEVGLAIGGYLIGSIPFGIIITRCLGAPDPRTAGSGNIGFTNVLRVAGKRAGLLTLIGDVGKGWLVGWLARQLLQNEASVVTIALTPIVGHLFPLFLNFKGGKGVATAIGVVLGTAPLLGAGLIATWLLAAAWWRYSSAAALTAFGLLPIMASIAGASVIFRVFAVVVALLVVMRHWENMVRLWRGQEPRIGQGNKLT